MPWKNGLGTTHEILVARWAESTSVPLDRELVAVRDGGFEDFDVRISVAEVSASGPFSSFVGIDRWITELDGARVTLTHDGREITLARYAPHPFAGEAATTAVIDRPTRDYNVMTRRATTSAIVTRAGLAAHATMTLEPSDAPRVVFVAEGEAVIEHNKERVEVGPGDTVMAVYHAISVKALTPLVLILASIDLASP